MGKKIQRELIAFGELRARETGRQRAYDVLNNTLEHIQRHGATLYEVDEFESQFLAYQKAEVFTPAESKVWQVLIEHLRADTYSDEDDEKKPEQDDPDEEARPEAADDPEDGDEDEDDDDSDEEDEEDEESEEAEDEDPDAEYDEDEQAA